MNKSMFLFVFLTFISTQSIFGQLEIPADKASKKPRPHKIVFQMVSKDTADHNAMVRQLNNILKLAPNAKLEVVCHGPGITLIQKNKSYVLDQLSVLAGKKVDFVACEFTMSQKNLKKEQLLDVCRTVPGGILEIVERQEKGWTYIKAGY
ncbi:MAG: DsrE family protein [Saprospiraceae bacterium]|jgi:intracellular sulfur oxidation DsrE/DsrF family protein|nr:DsrE family protein [Saprospiraceae bacterium]